MCSHPAGNSDKPDGDSDPAGYSFTTQVEFTAAADFLNKNIWGERVQTPQKWNGDIQEDSKYLKPQRFPSSTEGAPPPLPNENDS